MKSVYDLFESYKLALLISLGYVGLGTLAVCSVYPADMFYGSWSLWALVITFPVTIVSFGYRFIDSQNLYPVWLIQSAMFLIMFVTMSLELRVKKKSAD
jgi:hypothetical protein